MLINTVICACICLAVYIFLCTYPCVYMPVYIYTCTYICLYKYTCVQGSRKSKIGTIKKWLPCAVSRTHIFVVYKIVIPIIVVFMHLLQTNLAGNLHFQQLIFAGRHLFLKLFQLASQKWLPKFQIGWEHVPTVPIFLEPCLCIYACAYACVCLPVEIFLCTYPCVYMNVYTCLCIYACDYMLVNIWLCLSLWPWQFVPLGDSREGHVTPQVGGGEAGGGHVTPQVLLIHHWIHPLLY